MKFVYPSVFDPTRNIEVWFCDDPCCSGKELHRGGGKPAVTYADGTKEWWLHGKRVTEQEALAHNGELVAKAAREGLSRRIVISRPISVSSTSNEGLTKTDVAGDGEK